VFQLIINSANSGLFKKYCKGDSENGYCSTAYGKYCNAINNGKDIIDFIDPGCTCIENDRIIQAIFPNNTQLISTKEKPQAPCIFAPCVDFLFVGFLEGRELHGL
jgi:hypothetical protein